MAFPAVHADRFETIPGATMFLSLNGADTFEDTVLHYAEFPMTFGATTALLSHQIPKGEFIRVTLRKNGMDTPHSFILQCPDFKTIYAPKSSIHFDRFDIFTWKILSTINVGVTQLYLEQEYE
jgi:hypothetical protein